MRAAGRATRDRILAAAKDEFTEYGFAGARLNRIAATARASKERLYSYFASKEQLFEAVIRNAVSPLIERLQALATAPAVPLETALEALAAMFEKEVLGTSRKLVVRLVISEGPRFPRSRSQKPEARSQNLESRIQELCPARQINKTSATGQLSED